MQCVSEDLTSNSPFCPLAGRHCRLKGQLWPLRHLLRASRGAHVFNQRMAFPGTQLQAPAWSIHLRLSGALGLAAASCPRHTRPGRATPVTSSSPPSVKGSPREKAEPRLQLMTATGPGESVPHPSAAPGGAPHCLLGHLLPPRPEGPVYALSPSSTLLPTSLFSVFVL